MDEFGDSDQRSIFSALWFRALLAVLILGILAAVAVPYVLDYATRPSVKTAAKSPAATPPPPTADPAAPTASPAPAASTAAPLAPAAATPTTAVPAQSPPAQETAKPKVAPAPAAKSVAKTAKAAEVQTKATKVAEEQTKAAKVAEAPKPAPKAAAAKSSPATVAPTGGPYWVQVGAFKDAETAKRLVARLREQGLPAEASTVNSAAPQRPAAPAVEGSAADRYDIVVSGASPAEVGGKLAAKGLTGETTPTGIVVRPSLALREAVALSRELADAGLSVQVRRVGGPVPVAAPAPPPAPAAAAATLHRVRVGGFPDRATAVSAAKQLEEKGFKPFIARGNE